jgi:hypothetical protein
MKRTLTLVTLACMLFSNLILQAQDSPSVFADPSIQQKQVIYATGNAANRDAVLGYFVNMRDPIKGVYSFPVPSFAPFTLVGNPAMSNVYGGDIGPGGQYFVEMADLRLYTLDKTSGVPTFITDITGLVTGETIITGMAYHEATNVMYISTPTRLYTLNLSTGAATLVGDITTGGLIICIAINCEGQMYGVDIASDVLISINTATGAGTVVGPVGYPANFAQGADFDNATGILYWAAYSGGGVSGIRTIDLVTGNSTEVVPTTGYEIDGFVIEGVCEQPEVPISNWAIMIGLLMILSVLIFRYKR